MTGHATTASSPKHGYTFDGFSHDIRRAHKTRSCRGARSSAGPIFAADCRGVIIPGTLYVATIDDSLRSETPACLPCALAAGAIQATTKVAR